MPITIDTSAILGLKPATTSLSDLISMARGAQAYQQAEKIYPLVEQQQQQLTRTGEINLGVAEQTDKERRNIMTYLANPTNWQTNGRIDLDKINKDIPTIAPLTGREVINNLTSIGTAQTQSIEAKQKLNTTLKQDIGSTLGLLGRVGASKEVTLKELDNLEAKNPNNADYSKLLNAYREIAKNIPEGKDFSAALIRESDQLLPPSQQQQQFAPQAGLTSVGGGAQPVITTPSVGGKAPSVRAEGALIPYTLGPESIISATGRTDPAGNPTYYFKDPSGKGIIELPVPAGAVSGQVPAAPKAAPSMPGAAPAAPVAPAGALPGQPAAKPAAQPPQGVVRAPPEIVTQAKDDWAATYNRAKGSEQTIATLQNINKAAQKAFTSTGGERKELIAGIAQAVGIDVYTLEKTATDELAKNSAILQLAGGDTNLAREIAGIANPNKKMTKEAITNVTGQLIGVERMYQARANYLQDYVGNPQDYVRKAREFDRFADYRIFQEMTPEQVKSLKSSMSKAEQEAMTKKIREAKMLGIIR